MRDGWYDVRVRVNGSDNETIEKDVVLLCRNGEFYQDYDQNARSHPRYKGEIIKVYTDEPKMELAGEIDCDGDHMKNFIAAIYVRAINDYRKALVSLHYHPSNAAAHTKINQCEQFLDGFTVRNKNVIEATRERAKYVIFRRDHKCRKCRFKGCPHRSLDCQPNGDFTQFRKVGCMKNENRNT